MKNTFRVSEIILMILSVFLLYSCKKEKIPMLTTSAITNITGTTATSGGTITDEGSGTIIARGVCWSTGITPTLSDSKTTDGAGAGSFTSNMSGLNGATTYYVRAYATNSVGTGYGMTMSFSTMGKIPTALTNSATDITTTSATLNGIINANYLSTIVTFEYGTTTNYGASVTISQNPITGNTNTGVSANVSGLLGGTIYNFRVKTVNSLGTTYGNDISFTTLGQLPTTSTQAATNILQTTATLNGIVNPNYLQTTVTFEYGTTTSYGSIASAKQSPVLGNSNVSVTADITGLTAATIYHFRVKAVNSLGATFGSDMTFTTGGPVTDIDGNIYNVITIGNQVWMKENLKTTKYNDGTSIPLVTDATTWTNLATPGYCWYNNDATTYKAIYGALYNWYTVQMGKLCPAGWHVPTDNEWTTLTDYLTNNGYGYGGSGINIAKSLAAASGWNPYSIAGTVGNDQVSNNNSGFTALPGGDRNFDGTGTFYGIGYNGNWWSSTDDRNNGNTLIAWARNLYYDGSNVFSFYYYKQIGFSVRCLRDN